MRRRRHIILSLLLAGALWPVAGRAGDPGARLMVPDVCVEDSTAVVPLVLSGAATLRPASLRTTLLYNPRQVEPVEIRSSVGRHLSSHIDEQRGEVTLTWHTEGRLPVQPLPAGVLALVTMRQLEGAAGEAQVSLDPGQTRSLDGNGRSSWVATSGPASLVQGSGGLWVEVMDEGRTAWVTSAGLSPRGRPWILRGSMESLARAGRRVLLGTLEPLETSSDGRLAADEKTPDRGEIFFYLAARDDGAGQPVLGFGSDCRPRMVLPASAAGR